MRRPAASPLPRPFFPQARSLSPLVPRALRSAPLATLTLPLCRARGRAGLAPPAPALPRFPCSCVHAPRQHPWATMLRAPPVVLSIAMQQLAFPPARPNTARCTRLLPACSWPEVAPRSVFRSAPEEKLYAGERPSRFALHFIACLFAAAAHQVVCSAAGVPATARALPAGAVGAAVTILLVQLGPSTASPPFRPCSRRFGFFVVSSGDAGV